MNQFGVLNKVMNESIATVAVIIPNFNTPKTYLKESFESLRRQTFADFVCVVVDESDNTVLADACEKECSLDCRFQYHKPSERLGLAGSLNFGFSLVDARYYARFDTDDICDPERLEKQVSFMENNPDISVCGSNITIIDNDGNVIGQKLYPEHHNQIERAFVATNAVAHPATMMRATVLENNQRPYDQSYLYCEDLELWLRLLRLRTKFSNIQENLLYYRQNAPARVKANWKYNLRARTQHLSEPAIVLKLLSVGALFIWSILPNFITNQLYKVLLLKKK